VIIDEYDLQYHRYLSNLWKLKFTIKIQNVTEINVNLDKDNYIILL